MNTLPGTAVVGGTYVPLTEDDPVICVERMHTLPGTAVSILELGCVGAIPYDLFSFRQLSVVSCRLSVEPTFL